VGEFGPVLIAADAIALKTEVLPTRLYVGVQAGQLQAAGLAALLLVLLSLLAHGVLRRLGGRPSVQIQECEP
jgi:ABC-type sulfate transport system permease component